MSFRSCFHLSLLVTLVTISISAQPREITKEEFDAMEKAARAKLNGATYRVRVTAKPDPRSVKSEYGGLISEISEQVSTDRRRVVRVWQLSDGTRKEETVEGGDRKFIRKNDGVWEDVSKRDPTRYSGFGSAIDDQKVIATYRNLGVDPVRDIHAELIEEMIYREYVVENRKMAFGYVNRLWISKDGRLMKSEWKNSGSDGLVKSYRVSEYEYDPNIKIELPKN